MKRRLSSFLKRLAAYLRNLAYEALTQAIIWLGLLREAVMCYQPEKVRLDRVFDVYSLESWSCCDCGLVHRFRTFSDDGSPPCGHVPDPSGLITVGHAWPIRPKNYGYRWRAGAGTPSLAVPLPEDVGDIPRPVAPATWYMKDKVYPWQRN